MQHVDFTTMVQAVEVAVGVFEHYGFRLNDGIHAHCEGCGQYPQYESYCVMTEQDGVILERVPTIGLCYDCLAGMHMNPFGGDAESSMNRRRTNIYTVRVSGPARILGDLEQWFRDTGTLVNRGYYSGQAHVSFQADCDSAAMLRSTAALGETGLMGSPVTLTTGFGIGRRTVA